MDTGEEMWGGANIYFKTLRQEYWRKHMYDNSGI